jgi:hypothetical protein
MNTQQNNKRSMRVFSLKKKVAFLYSNNVLTEIEVRKKNPFTSYLKNKQNTQAMLNQRCERPLQ